MMKTYLLCLFSMTMILFTFSCKPSTDQNAGSEEEQTDNMVEIVSYTMDFHCVDTIKSGWTKFKFSNKSEEVHFFVLEKYPEGKLLADGRKEIFPIFQDGMNLIASADMEGAMAKFGELPEWYQEVVFEGGSALVSPKTSSYTMLDMKPGYYVMECYVKMTNGIFHAAMGMSKALVVLEDKNENEEPKADNIVSISSIDGIALDTTISKGMRTIAVDFVDQKLYGNFVGHDLNLVKYNDGADLDSLDHWMNWVHVDGLITPPPSGFDFLGGVNDMPAGSRAYFSHNFEKGNYVFISEVAAAKENNLMHRFTVE